MGQIVVPTAEREEREVCVALKFCKQLCYTVSPTIVKAEEDEPVTGFSDWAEGAH